MTRDIEPTPSDELRVGNVAYIDEMGGEQNRWLVTDIAPPSVAQIRDDESIGGPGGVLDNVTFRVVGNWAIEKAVAAWVRGFNPASSEEIANLFAQNYAKNARFSEQ